MIFQRVACSTELSASMTGSFVLIGALLHSPSTIFFDNQGTNSVQISVDGGTTVWKTFAAGEAISIDFQVFSFDKGTTFYGNGTNADGPFKISYLYPVNQ